MHPVLLVIDMQEHFREMAERCLPALSTLIDACHSLDIPVIYTQHGHLDPEAEAASSVLVRWWGAGGSIRHGSPAWQLLPELRRRPGQDVVITSKRTYDCFQGTELLQLLRRQGCDTVVVGGVMTNLCCETTARSAFTQNFEVCFLSDGTATASQRMHAASLLNLGYGFARVLSCTDMAAELLAQGKQALPPRGQAAAGQERAAAAAEP